MFPARKIQHSVPKVYLANIQKGSKVNDQQRRIAQKMRVIKMVEA